MLAKAIVVVYERRLGYIAYTVLPVASLRPERRACQII